MDTFTLTVVTPEGVFLEKEATLVELPTEDGVIGILPGHIPLMAAIGAGELRVYHDDENTERFVLAGGFLQINIRGVRLVAGFAATDEGEQIEEAVERARVALAEVQSLSEKKVRAELLTIRTELMRLSEMKRNRGRGG